MPTGGTADRGASSHPARRGGRSDDDDGGGGSVGAHGGTGGYHWTFLPVGRSAPPVGGRVTGGSLVAPDPGVYSVRRGGVDPAGGVVRGGFGGGGSGSVGG